MGLIDFLKEQVSLEERLAEDLRALSKRIDHPMIKAVIQALSNDSMKHSQLYKAASMIAEVFPRLGEGDVKVVKEEFRRHIELEAERMRIAKRAMDESEDPELKLLIGAIYNDEVNHHALLNRIYEAIVEKELPTDEEIWELVWESSPWRGGPGG